MTSSPFSISPLPPPAVWSALPAAVARILMRRRIGLSRAAHKRLLEDLQRACVQALPSIDLTDAAQLDRAVLAEIAAIPTGTAPQKAVRDETRRLARHAREAYSAATAAPQPVVTKPHGIGRPAETWKRLLVEDVRRALLNAGVTRGNYVSHDQDQETVLTEIVRACAESLGHRLPGSLREAAGPVRQRQ